MIFEYPQAKLGALKEACRGSYGCHVVGDTRVPQLWVGVV